jgi:hypothetical protein
MNRWRRADIQYNELSRLENRRRARAKKNPAEPGLSRRGEPTDDAIVREAVN